jgi:hypothetical protein
MTCANLSCEHRDLPYANLSCEPGDLPCEPDDLFILLRWMSSVKCASQFRAWYTYLGAYNTLSWWKQVLPVQQRGDTSRAFHFHRPVLTCCGHVHILYSSNVHVHSYCALRPPGFTHTHFTPSTYVCVRKATNTVVLSHICVSESVQILLFQSRTKENQAQKNNNLMDNRKIILV